jgi:hypothetical protein
VAATAKALDVLGHVVAGVAVAVVSVNGRSDLAALTDRGQREVLPGYLAASARTRGSPRAR